MLSILIPTYNQSCRLLVEELSQQIDKLHIDAEIVVIDDASDNAFSINENQKINKIAHSRLIKLDKHISIAKIRNRLIDEAKYDTLLFLDADVFPVKKNFIEIYLNEIKNNDIVCGGITYRKNGPIQINPLRYKYGMNAEAIPADKRQLHQYNSFCSSNFIAKNYVTHNIRFDESFERYGHEDTLFGKHLQIAGYKIKHIDNKIFHDTTDSSQDFLIKSRLAIDNLCTHIDKLQSYSQLITTYNKINKFHLTWLMRFIYEHFDNLMQHNLLGKHPSLFIFNLYKLSYFCCAKRLTDN